MAFLKRIIKLFKNDGDVYYSEGGINIGLQLKDYIKILELTDVSSARGIENYIKVGEEIYGKSFLERVEKGQIDKSQFWSRIRNRISEELEEELDMDNLENSILNELKIFYQKIDRKDVSEALNISKEILIKIGVNDSSLSLYHYLEYEINKSNNNYKEAYSSIEKAISLCFSNIYLSTILNFTQGIFKRPDLALEQFEKHFTKIKKNELTEDLLFNISNFFLANKNYEVTESICERILYKSNFGDNNVWKYFFLANLVGAKICSFQLSNEDEEKYITTKLEIVYDGLKSLYGENSVYIAKAYYSNYSLYYTKKFFITLENLKVATPHKAFDYISLFDDKEFLNLNFKIPRTFIANALENINKVIEVKKRQDKIYDLGQTLSNLVVIYIDELKLRELFRWKINYLCEQYSFEYSKEIKLFNEHVQIDIILSKIEKTIYSLPDLYPNESYELSNNLTLLSDSLKTTLNEKSSLVNWCYEKALQVMPNELKKENDLYLYLKKQIQKQC